MSDHADRIKRLRGISIYLHGVAHTAEQLQRAGVSVAVDLSAMREVGGDVDRLVVELLLLDASAKADVVLANPPFKGPIS